MLLVRAKKVEWYRPKTPPSGATPCHMKCCMYSFYNVCAIIHLCLSLVKWMMYYFFIKDIVILQKIFLYLLIDIRYINTNADISEIKRVWHRKQCMQIDASKMCNFLSNIPKLFIFIQLHINRSIYSGRCCSNQKIWVDILFLRNFQGQLSNDDQDIQVILPDMFNICSITYIRHKTEHHMLNICKSYV